MKCGCVMLDLFPYGTETPPQARLSEARLPCKPFVTVKN